MKNFKRIIAYAFILLLIIFLMSYLYPRKINREFSGVMYRLGESNYSENIKVYINGYLSKGLIRGDKFEGSIAIGDKQLEKINMRFDDVGRGNLFYFDEDTGDFTSYGDIYSDNILDVFTICVLEEDGQINGGKAWSGKNGLMISAPVDTRVEALGLSNRLMKDVLIYGELK